MLHKNCASSQLAVSLNKHFLSPLRPSQLCVECSTLPYASFQAEELMTMHDIMAHGNAVWLVALGWSFNLEVARVLYQNKLICIKEHSIMKWRQVQPGSEYSDLRTFVSDGVCFARQCSLETTVHFTLRKLGCSQICREWILRDVLTLYLVSECQSIIKARSTRTDSSGWLSTKTNRELNNCFCNAPVKCCMLVIWIPHL